MPSVWCCCWNQVRAVGPAKGADITMNICIFRESTTGLLRHVGRWIFQHNCDYTNWYVDYDKVTSLVKTSMIIGVEYNLSRPSGYSDDVVITRLKAAPLPDDVVAEFRERLASITSKLLVAPLKNV